MVFWRQNHITFIFIKMMSHDLLVQMACQRNMSPGCCTQSFEKENIVWWNILVSWKTFAVNFNVVLQVTYCFFMNCWLAHNQLSWNYVLLFSCNPIGQLYLCGPSYRSQNVRLMWIIFKKVKWIICGKFARKYKIWLFKTPKDFCRN